MVRYCRGLVAAAALFGMAGVAQADLAVSPGNQTGTPGQVAEWTFAIDGSSENVVSSFGYGIAYGTAEQALFEPVLVGTKIDCTFAPDLRSGLENNTSSQPNRPDGGRLRIVFGDFSDPIEPIGRGGDIATCKFMIKADAPEGSYPLNCIGSATATDPDANDIPTTCTAGNLVISVPTNTPTSPPTNTPTATLTRTPTPVFTNTSPPTNTATRTHTPPPTATQVASTADDGCNVGGGSSNSLLFMLLPVAALTLVRRRVK